MDYPSSNNPRAPIRASIAGSSQRHASVYGLPNDEPVARVAVSKDGRKIRAPMTSYLKATSRSRSVMGGGSFEIEEITGDCPVCQQANLKRMFSPAGIACAILLPLVGIVCCFMLSEKRCPNCAFVEA